MQRPSSIQNPNQNPRGRGATINPGGRFEKLAVIHEPDPDSYDETEGGEADKGRQLKTEIFRDASRTIIARNDSPDVCFSTSLNPYRGCEHGCIYCFARPTHEYLGLSAGLDFETKIFAKMDAPALLRRELSAKSWTPQAIVMSGVTDCYQPVERALQLTRGCLGVLAEFRNPAAIITKNFLVTRDIDHLAALAAHDAIMVNISVTTLDGDLARKMEPRASRPERRLKAIEMLSRAGIPVNVMIGPVVPGLTDHEIPAILERAAQAGATGAGHVMLRLPYGVKDLFADWLQVHFPDRKERVLNRVREMRGGRLNDPRFGHRQRGEGPYAEQVSQMFHLCRRKYGLDRERPGLSAAAFRRPATDGQGELFG
jgi:DNA repair photolyase